MKKRRNNSGTVLVESAIVIPIFLLLIFGCFELSRILYVYNTCGIAAQAVAANIGYNIAPYGNVINLTDFDPYATDVRFPGSVMENAQYSYDILDSSNMSIVSGGSAVGVNSRKVVVTVSFPPPNFSQFRIPIFDPGTLVNGMMFPVAGVAIMSSATALIQYSRRPTI